MGRRRKSSLLPESAYKLHVTYPKIYLIADKGEQGASIRVTDREKEPGIRPGEVHFSGRRPDQEGNPLGTLVIDEEMWKQWFGNRARLPHMDTAVKAAEWMVTNCKGIHYGCPICLFRTKSYDDYLAHIREIGAWVQKQFKVDVELLQLEGEDGDSD